MNRDPLKDLIAYRLAQAQEALDEDELLMKAGHFRGAVNRAYYAMFYATQALLAHSGSKASKHAGIISLFDREFVKPGLIEKDYSKWLHELFDLRQGSDYGDMFQVDEEQVQRAHENAKSFVARVQVYLEKHGFVD